MKYPCEGCLVDPICISDCNLLYFYIKFLDRQSIKIIPDEVVHTRDRLDRALYTAAYNDISYKLFMKIVSITNEKKW